MCTHTPVLFVVHLLALFLIVRRVVSLNSGTSDTHDRFECILTESVHTSFICMIVIRCSALTDIGIIEPAKKHIAVHVKKA